MKFWSLFFSGIVGNPADLSHCAVPHHYAFRFGERIFSFFELAFDFLRRCLNRAFDTIHDPILEALWFLLLRPCLFSELPVLFAPFCVMCRLLFRVHLRSWCRIVSRFASAFPLFLQSALKICPFCFRHSHFCHF